MYAMPLRIRQARAACGLSQDKLAVRVGVRRSAVAQWESPEGTSPNVAHLAQVAVVTGVCFEWLATGRGPVRLEAGALEPAVMSWDFAKDDLESRVLASIRCLSRRNRQIACRIIELMAV